MRYRSIVPLLAFAALGILPGMLSAQTLTDVLVGTAIDANANVEGLRAAESAKTNARIQAEVLEEYNAALEAEMDADSAPRATTVSGPEVKVRTVVSVVPEPATGTPRAVSAPSARAEFTIERGSGFSRASERAPALEAVATEGDARTFAEAQMRSDPNIVEIRAASGTLAIERDDAISLFWIFDTTARVEIVVDAETGEIDVDLPWWAKLAGKSSAARSLESLDPKAVRAALAGRHAPERSARMLALVAGAYRGEAAIDAKNGISDAASTSPLRNDGATR